MKPTIREIFSFLLSDDRFHECVEEHGLHYRQAHFRSPALVLRIAEQQEVSQQGMSFTCLAFLVDPNNQNRWCMFEKAVETMLNRKLEGSENLQELKRKVRDNIDSILGLIANGSKPPFEVF
jgi:hypothetical protein